MGFRVWCLGFRVWGLGFGFEFFLIGPFSLQMSPGDALVHGPSQQSASCNPPHGVQGLGVRPSSAWRVAHQAGGLGYKYLR